jgi:hypothetical protein
MNKYLKRLVLGGLLALSAFAVVEVFTELVWAKSIPLACPSCDPALGYPGTTCRCPSVGRNDDPRGRFRHFNHRGALAGMLMLALLSALIRRELSPARLFLQVVSLKFSDPV